MNMNYNTPYMDEYLSPDETARRSIRDSSFNFPPSAVAVETFIENSHEHEFSEEELSARYFSLDNFDTQFLEKKGNGPKLINRDQHETVNKEQTTFPIRSYDQGEYVFNKSAAFDPYHQKEIHLTQFQEKGERPLIYLDQQETVDKEQARFSNRSFDQGKYVFNKSAAFDLCHQKETHLTQFQGKGVQRQKQQEMSLEKKVLERSLSTTQPLYSNQGIITKNNSGLKLEKQKEISLTVECDVGSTSVIPTKLQLFPKNNILANTLEDDSRLQLEVQEETPRCNILTNEGALERSSVVSNFLNYNSGKVEENHMGLKFASQQQKPINNENAVVRTPVISRFMDNIPSKNSEKGSHLQLETQEVTAAKQQTLGRSIGISYYLNNNCGRDAEGNLGLKFETRQNMSYTTESVVGRTLVISGFQDSTHPKMSEKSSHVQLDAQEEMSLIDSNDLGRSLGVSPPMKNICTKLTTDDISIPLDKTEACGSTDENQGSLKSLCPLFAGKSNSEFGQLKETSKSRMDEKVGQLACNFRRIQFSPFLPKFKNDPIAEGATPNLRKTAIAQRSAIYELIRSYLERINLAQQAIRANSIRITNVKEKHNEDTTLVVLDIFRQIMKVDIDFSDIESCQRKSCGRGTKPVIVRFYSSRIKTMIFSQKLHLCGTKIRIEEELSHDRAELLKMACSIFGKKNVGIKNGYITVILSDENTVNFSSLSEFKAFLRKSSVCFINTDDLSDNELM